MTCRLDELLYDWSDKTITLDRVNELMERGPALALAMEKWLRAGLWVMTRSDPDYPVRFKQRLRTDSPAVLFGCGNRALLNGGGLAVIGSRKANDENLAYSRALGALAAHKGYSIVSGGARGVDEASMLGALDAEGTVIGVLADSLLPTCSSMKYRKYLMANNLVLVSTFYPETGFNAGNAMQRNKYIYCLSDSAVVVHSGMKGGTWNGAMENLEKQWVPLWVKRTTDKLAGNSDIVEAGAIWVSEHIGEVDFTTLFTAKTSDRESAEDIYGNSTGEFIDKEGTYAQSAPIETRPNSLMEDVLNSECENSATQTPVEDIEFYDLFLIKIKAICSDSPKTPDELVDALKLNKSQLNTWLKRAVMEKKLEKLLKPVRYQWLTTQQGALLL